jgi:hypothetical protein
LLGILYAALGAFTFALNNVAMRRGVVTGSVLQGMAMTARPAAGIRRLSLPRLFDGDGVQHHRCRSADTAR